MFRKKLLSVIMAVGVTATSTLPAAAAPMLVAPPAATKPADVVQVQDRRGNWNRGDFRYREGRGYYRGHRGYRQARPGYRRGPDGWWFPPAAFIAGAIIGGAIANDRPVVVRPRGARALNARHYGWCENRYRSYRAYDNTFQPYNGPRQQCWSPYS